MNYIFSKNVRTGRGVVLAKKQFSPTVSFSANFRLIFSPSLKDAVPILRINFLSNFIVKYR